MSTARPVVAALVAFLLSACAQPAADAPDSQSTTASPTPTSAAGSPSAGSSPTPTTPSPSRVVRAADQDLVQAVDADVQFEGIQTPDSLVADLQRGGHVIVVRYTGSGGPASPVPEALAGLVKDDSQRISDASIARMRAYCAAFAARGIPVNRVVSSEYYFVWQHAEAAFGAPIAIHRDLTGSLDFRDSDELAASLQGLRNRTVTAPDRGANTVLFTHQGKFDKAFGHYPDAGETIIFRPDGTGTPRVVAVLGYDDMMALLDTP